MLATTLHMSNELKDQLICHKMFHLYLTIGEPTKPALDVVDLLFY